MNRLLTGVLHLPVTVSLKNKIMYPNLTVNKLHPFCLITKMDCNRKSENNDYNSSPNLTTL